MKQPNYRFWTYWNSDWVKLTLRPGLPITLCRGGRTEEGWSLHIETFTHVGNGVRRDWEDDGCDCDGRLSQSSADFAHGTELAAIPVAKHQGDPWWDRSADYHTAADHHDGRLIHRPAWTEILPSQVYDEYAQAAGY